MIIFELCIMYMSHHLFAVIGNYTVYLIIMAVICIALYVACISDASSKFKNANKIIHKSSLKSSTILNNNV